MASDVEIIKSRLSIVDVCGGYVTLEKAGGNWKARCPFHNERTPSFFVSPTRNSFHCFGCSRGGDIFTFVSEIEGVDFVEALRILADRAGVTLTRQNSAVKTKRDRLSGIIEEAVSFFEIQIGKHPQIHSYLTERGVTKETTKGFRLGFAPPGWDNLVTHLVRKDYKLADVADAGLIIPHPQVGGRYYDRFRGRLMFPITNESGKIVGFSGRSMDVPDEKIPKYINSPQTLLYDKSRVLYGYSKAKDAIRKHDKCIVVEGQMDVILSHGAGFINTCAVSGTQLTVEHANLIGRLTKNIVFAYDSDESGIKASKRGVEQALKAGFNVCMVEIPDGNDPADIIKSNPAEWERGTKEAKHVIDFYLKILTRRGHDKRALRVSVAGEILPYVKMIPSKVEQAHFISELAHTLAIQEESLWEELRETKAPVIQKSTSAQPPAEKRKRRREIIIERIFGVILWQDGERESAIDRTLARKRFKTLLTNQEHEEVIALEKGVKEKLIFEAEAYYGGSEHLPEHVDDLLANLEEENIKEELTRVITNLRESEQKHNEKEVEKNIKRCKDVSRRLSELRVSRKT